MSISSLYLIITNKCNLHCEFCYHNQTGFKNIKREKNIPLEDLLSFIQKNSSISQIFITGGEPLQEKEYLLSLLKAVAAENELRANKIRVTLITNGTRYLSELKEFAPLIYLQISIDGGKLSHDFQRKSNQKNFSYVGIISNFWKYMYDGFQINIHSLMIPKVKNIFLFKNGIYRLFRDVPSDVPIRLTYEHTSRENIFISWYMEKVIERIIFKARKSRHHKNFVLNPQICGACGAGANSLAVDVSTGKLYPCMEFVGNETYVSGDIYNYSPLKLDWQNLSLYRIQHLPKKFNELLLKKNFIPACPAINKYSTGKEFLIPLKEVVHAYMRRKLWRI